MWIFFIKLLRVHGVILFSGYNFKQEELGKFTCKFGQTIGNLDVFTGRSALEPHAELAFLPQAFQPDFVWFYCLNPSSTGGQTTVCDGLSIFNAMDEPTKEFLYSVPAQFNRSLNSLSWKMTFGVKNKKEAKFKFDNLIDKNNFKYYFDANDNLNYQYSVSQITKSKLLNVDVFANTVLIGRNSTYGMSFADGSSNEGTRLEYLLKLAERHTVEIKWKPFYFILIDNTTVMHGRRAYTDPNRLLKAYHTVKFKSPLSKES